MTVYRLHISLRYCYSAQRILYLWYYYYNGQSIDLFELCLVYRIVPFRSDDYGTQSLQSLVIFYRGYIYICYQSTTQYTLAVLLRIYIRAFIIVVLSVHLVVISARGYLCRFYYCAKRAHSLLVLWQQLIWYYYILHKVMSDITTVIGYRQCIFRSGLIIVCRVHIYSLYYYSIRVGYYYHLQSLQLCLILLPL